jgi:hypothetical protein
MSRKKRKQAKPNKYKTKGRSKLIVFLCAFFIVLTIFGVFLNNYGSNLKTNGEQERDRLIANYRGTLTPSYNINVSKLFIVSIGTISTGYTASELATGIDLSRFIHIDFGNQTVEFPFRLSFDNNLIHVYATIKDKNNQTIGTINDNDWWSANPQNIASLYSRNYNSYAFELIDENRMPVLQVLLDKPNEIDLGVNLLSQGLPYYFGINGTHIGFDNERYWNNKK